MTRNVVDTIESLMRVLYKMLRKVCYSLHKIFVKIFSTKINVFVTSSSLPTSLSPQPNMSHGLQHQSQCNPLCPFFWDFPAHYPTILSLVNSSFCFISLISDLYGVTFVVCMCPSLSIILPRWILLCIAFKSTNLIVYWIRKSHKLISVYFGSRFHYCHWFSWFVHESIEILDKTF